MNNLVLDWIVSHRWAILPEMLMTVLKIARGDLTIKEARDAIAARDGELLQDTRNVMMYGSSAVISITGPIFPRASFFKMISGGTPISAIAKDFTAALEDPNVKQIILNIDSPGGEITGVSELANMIYQARGQKPIVAYVYGLGASAAYWIASAADKIVASDTAELGSIGVVSMYTDYSEQSKKQGVQEYEVVSSQSPKKRMTPATEDGKAEIQKLVDELADVFIASIARNRNVSTQKVIEEFGNGGVLIGQSAVKAGLADEIGSLESVLSSFSNTTQTGGFPMNIEELKVKHPEIYNAVFELGKKAGLEEGNKFTQAAIDQATKTAVQKEHGRMKGILEIKTAGSEKLISDSLFNTEATAESVALAIVKGGQQNQNNIAQALADDGTALAAQLQTVSSSAPDSSKASTEEAFGKKVAELWNNQK